MIDFSHDKWEGNAIEKSAFLTGAAVLVLSTNLIVIYLYILVDNLSG